MIETRRLKNIVILIQTILSFVLSRIIRCNNTFIFENIPGFDNNFYICNTSDVKAKVMFDKKKIPCQAVYKKLHI